MNRFGIRTRTNPTPNPWRGLLAGAAVLAALGFATVQPAKADDVARPNIGSNYEQYEHDARVHSQQLTDSRASDAEARDQALAEQQYQNQRAAQDQNAARQAHIYDPNAPTNQ